jgi:hypothetical protein
MRSARIRWFNDRTGVVTSLLFVARASVITPSASAQEEAEDDFILLDEAIDRRDAQLLELMNLQAQFSSLETGGWELPLEGDFSDVTFEPWMIETIDRLDDPSFEARDQATNYLVDSCSDLRQLFAMLIKLELSVEQHQRILEVIHRHLMHRPRGALGINMDQNHFNRQIPGEIRINDLLPNLPAEKVLRVDDRITHFNGIMLQNRGELIEQAQSRLPGERITLTVHRPRLDERGQYIEGPDQEPVLDELQITLELGSADKLLDPVTGLPLRGGPVLQQRREQAVFVSQHFAAEPLRVVASNGDAEPFFSASLQITDEMIEQHVDIQLLVRQIAVAQTSPPDIADAYREQWRQRLAYLRQQAVAPEWSDLDREFFTKLSARYEELVQPLLQ